MAVPQFDVRNQPGSNFGSRPMARVSLGLSTGVVIRISLLDGTVSSVQWT